MNKKIYIIISLFLLIVSTVIFVYYYFQTEKPLPEVKIYSSQEEKISLNGIIKSINDNYLIFISSQEHIPVFLGENTEIYRIKAEEETIPQKEIISWADLEENENIYVYAKKNDDKFIAVTIIINR